MTKLSYLHEPGVLHNLAIRYSFNEIYVRCTVPTLLYSLWIRHIAYILLKKREIKRRGKEGRKKNGILV